MLIAIDTGGTKTLIADFNQKGEIGSQIKFPTPKDKKEYIESIKKTINENFKVDSIEAIVLAVPGIVKNGVAIWCNNLGWKDFDILSALKETFSAIPILIGNDANLAGLSETRFLDKTPELSLYVTISTGIGSGVITNGHINLALQNSEVGHALIEYNGTVQEWENFASGRMVRETYGMYASEIQDVQIWKQIADKISRGFLAVIPILQPNTIIIGGSIGTYFEKYNNELIRKLEEKLPEHIPCPEFIQAKYPELAVIYGCYYYALDNLFNQ